MRERERERGERWCQAIRQSAGVFRRRRQRNGSGIVPGDIRREMVRDEPRVDCYVLPGRDEEVPKGESVDIRLPEGATPPFFRSRCDNDASAISFRKHSGYKEGIASLNRSVRVLRLSRDHCRLFRYIELGQIDVTHIGAQVL